MVARFFKVILFAIPCILLVITKGHTRPDLDEREIKVSMRMIGHKVLLNSGDKISRVLAIEKEEDRYKIQFESPFQFDPSELVTTIEQIVDETELATNYLVEVEKCATEEVVYSYKIMSFPERSDVIPCRGRIQPKACYELFITILDPVELPASPLAATSQKSEYLPSDTEKTNYLGLGLLIAAISMGLGIFFWKNEGNQTEIDPDVILIGEYQFDKRNMVLSHENEKTELTSKEADLLSLLNSSANRTLDREKILRIVWGDQGDYVGRTLDVFISKLRKKLSADPCLKIVNIRGVGYKFIVNTRS